MKLIALLLILPWLISSAEEAGAPKRGDNTIILDELGVKNLKIELAEAAETDFEETVFALGRIELLPGKKAVVSSRISGRATTVIALPDMRCEAGDELLWIESRQPGDPPPTVRVDAPIAGIIAKVDVAPGQPVTPDSSLMEIYDLSVVEAAAAVPEHLAGKLKKGLKARIKVPGYPDKTFEAELNHIGAEADVADGTLEAAFHVINDEDLLRPGMRAEFSIITGSRASVMAIPREAVQGEGAERYVYVADFELKNAFVKSPIEIGERNDAMVEALSGLLPGDQVVTRGAYALSFAGKGSVSLKEALDAAHGHAHNEDGTEMTAEQKAAKDSANVGHDHERESGGGPWKTASLVLAVLLVISLILPSYRKGSKDAKTAQ